MDIYLLDNQIRRIDVFDLYQSAIWTERYSDLGDCQIVTPSTSAARAFFAEGKQLATNDSNRVMTVETVTDATDSTGQELLTVVGRSLEDVLLDRVARNTMANLTTEPNWTLTGTPGNVARAMFDHICRSGSLNVHDEIPFLHAGTFSPVGTIPEPSYTISWVQEVDSLFNAIKAVCDGYGLGFRLIRTGDTSQLYFEIYAGNDRTSGQTDFTPVIFSVDRETIQSTTKYDSIQDSKNVAYVFSSVGTKMVYAPGVDASVAGFQRRVLMVNASDVGTDTPDVDAALTQEGLQALAATRTQSYFDGEVNQFSPYKYGVDYLLGDIVETQDKDGFVTYSRVTEQIFASDEQGERSYPTLVDLA